MHTSIWWISPDFVLNSIGYAPFAKFMTGCNSDEIFN